MWVAVARVALRAAQSDTAFTRLSHIFQTASWLSTAHSVLPGRLSLLSLIAEIPVVGLSVLTAWREPNARGAIRILLLGLRHSAFIIQQSLPLPPRPSNESSLIYPLEFHDTRILWDKLIGTMEMDFKETKRMATHRALSLYTLDQPHRYKHPKISNRAANKITKIFSNGASFRYRSYLFFKTQTLRVYEAHPFLE